MLSSKSTSLRRAYICKRIKKLRAKLSLERRRSTHSTVINSSNNERQNDSLGENCVVQDEFQDDFEDDFVDDSEDDFVDDIQDTVSSPIIEKNDLDHRERLRQWAASHNITRRALDELLPIIEDKISGLPKTGKGLMKSKVNYTASKMGEGKFCYLGIKKYVQCLTPDSCPTELHLHVNIDGLPLFHSSNCQFWPISGLFRNLNSSPFLIALFYGKSKPPLVNYLAQFIQEVKELETTLIHVGSKSVRVILSAIIADAPARAYLKCIKCHSGYAACERCVVHGDYDGHVIFNDLNARTRTNDSFRVQSDSDHHTGTSPLLSLNFDMVRHFPLDYMHLVCLGVVKRIIKFWIEGPPGPGRLAYSSLQNISENLLSFNPQVPTEFNRRHRSLKEVKYWKATEYRTFLLYTGFVAIKENVSDAVYTSFVTLQSAILILCNPCSSREEISFASLLLSRFIKSANNIYSQRFLSYNVHSLIHLADDFSMFGSLDKISAFPFENFLGSIKRKLKSGYLPFEQALRHASDDILTLKLENDHIVYHGQNDRRITSIANNVPFGNQYNSVFIKNIKFSCRQPDSCFISSNNKFYLIQNIIKKTSKECIFIAKQFQNQEDFFTKPFNSSNLGINFVSEIGDDLESISSTLVKSKCFLVSYREGFVASPMLNSGKLY